MRTTLTTKTIPEESPPVQGRMVSAFYLLTFLIGGFFLLAGGKLGSVIDLTVAIFYIALMLLFYALNKEGKERR